VSRFLLMLAVAAAAAIPARRAAGQEPDRGVPGLPPARVHDLQADGPGRIWVASDAGLFLCEAYATRRVGPEAPATALGAAPGGGVLVRLDGRNGRATPEGVEWTEDAVAFRPAQTSLTHHGEVWRATGSGVQRHRVTPRFRRHAIPTATRVHALAAAPDGSIWCCTENGLARIVDGGVETITAIGDRELGTVTACAVDREGRLWIGSGSSFRGVYRLDRAGWTHLDEIEGFVHRISTDPTGTLWFAVLDGTGVWTYTEAGLRRVQGVTELASMRVYDVVARDPSGVLWFATLTGLAAYGGQDRVKHYTPGPGGLAGEKVWCLCAARDGSLWIGYQLAFGASRLAHGELQHFGAEDGLGDGNVWAIAEGQPGVFWFATQDGLSRYDGKRWSCFHADEGLGAKAIWPLLPRPDGSLWIGTLGAGVVHLTPGPDLPPRTRLLEPEVRAAAGAPIALTWRGIDAWSDTAADDLWYRWRLDGGSWSSASPATTVTLRPSKGAHVFEVQAIDRFGNAERAPAVARVFVGGGVSWTWTTAGLALAVLAVARLRRARPARRGS